MLRWVINICHFFKLRETYAEVVYSYFRNFKIEVSYINISHNVWICALFFISITILWGSQNLPQSLHLDLEAKKHPSFAIFRSLCKIQHMFIYTNTLRLSTLIIYSSKFYIYVTSLIIHDPMTFPICHHVVNK